MAMVNALMAQGLKKAEDESNNEAKGDGVNKSGIMRNFEAEATTTTEEE